MPEIEIRPAVATDINRLMSLDHSGDSDYVWQQEFSKDTDQINFTFRRMRLPRSVRVYYPRPVADLSDNWMQSKLMLVAFLNGEPKAYLRLTDKVAPQAVWITDLVVGREVRRQGFAKALILSAQQWALQNDKARIMLEVTTKNQPAIALAQKLGFEFCGYNDQYYPSRDIALFFGRATR
jgi:ribosomal protein S18 acetylase RimI-like enzyme